MIYFFRHRLSQSYTMCEQTKNPESFYSYIGNYIEDRDELVREYAFDNKNVAESRMLKSWDWKPKRYSDIHPFIKNLCEKACESLGTTDLLEKNPEIVVERHHNMIKKNSKGNQFGIHTDDDGPAGGPCQSILYYYNVDENIIDSHLNFYEEEYSSNKEPNCIFQPKSGDAITFKNGIWHCPGNYTTESETPVLRGVFAIFILHNVPKPKKEIVPKSVPCCMIQ